MGTNVGVTVDSMDLLWVLALVWRVHLRGRGQRGGGLGSRPKKMYWEYLGDGVEYHLMKPTPRR